MGAIRVLPQAWERWPRESCSRELTSTSSALSLRVSPRVASDAAGAIPEARVSMFVVRRLVEAVESAGVPRQDILRATGIPQEALEEADTGVPRHLVERICELAIEPSADPALGLHWAESLTVHTFGPVSHTLMHTASLRQAFELLLQYEPLFCDQRIFVLEEEGQAAILRLVEWDVRSQRVLRFMTEMILTGFVGMLSQYDVRVERVCFAHSAPDYRAEYTRVFGPVVHFDQPFTGVVFERAALDRHNPHSDGEVRAALTDVLERRLVRATEDAPYSMRVRELLSQEATRRLNIEATARKLGLSERSLRRRLSAEGMTFREIQHDVFASLAEQLLQRKRLTIQETAHAMGFSDASAFHRAFKRWTGKTPRAFGER